LPSNAGTAKVIEDGLAHWYFRSCSCNAVRGTRWEKWESHLKSIIGLSGFLDAYGRAYCVFLGHVMLNPSIYCLCHESQNQGKVEDERILGKKGEDS